MHLFTSTANEVLRIGRRSDPPDRRYRWQWLAPDRAPNRGWGPVLDGLFSRVAALSGLEPPADHKGSKSGPKATGEAEQKPPGQRLAAARKSFTNSRPALHVLLEHLAGSPRPTRQPGPRPAGPCIRPVNRNCAPGRSRPLRTISRIPFGEPLRMPPSSCSVVFIPTECDSHRLRCVGQARNSWVAPAESVRISVAGRPYRRSRPAAPAGLRHHPHQGWSSRSWIKKRDSPAF